MARQVLLVCLIIGTLGAGSAWAHHKEPGRTHPVMTTVRITEPVMAGGMPLAPGTYEIVVNDERPTIDGIASEAQRTVDFLQNGTVVATEIAEVFPASEVAVGTSGRTGASRAVVQRLKGDEYLRIAMNGAGARYLVHLPLSPR